jgi:hypothetical protein
MGSRSNMSEFLVILTACDEYEDISSCCTYVGPAGASPHSWSIDSCLEVDSSLDVEDVTLYCQCDNDDGLVECLSCGSMLDTFCHGC